MATSNSSDCLKFMKLVGVLKHLKRTGWVKMEINDPETVSGHMYRMALMSFLVTSNDGIDRDRVMRMSLVHDLGESIVGDLTPYCGVSQHDKHKQEVAAIEHISALVPSFAGEEIKRLFMEYENQKTPESHFVKDLDRFDMILQAFEYEQKENRKGELEEFFQTTKNSFKHPKVVGWVEELMKERSESSKTTSTAPNQDVS